MESRMRGNSHVRFGLGEKRNIIYSYLSTQQLLVKKNAYNLDISKRSPKSGQISESDKVSRISDAETYSLSVIGATEFLKEAMGPRADDHMKKMEMYRKISNEGYVSLKDLPSDVESSTTLNTINVYLIGSGIDNDLITNTLLLPRTMKDKNKKK